MTGLYKTIAVILCIFLLKISVADPMRQRQLDNRAPAAIEKTSLSNRH